MPNFHLIVQAKGGVGKSFLTYLAASKKADNDTAIFVDCDASTKTTEKQITFLPKGRIFQVSLLDSRNKVAREKLFTALEALTFKHAEDIYIDFGAPESEQIPALLTLDAHIDDFVEFIVSLNASLQFHVVVAGGTSYAASVEYLKYLLKAIGEKIDLLPVIVWLNLFTFLGFESQMEQMKSKAKSLNIQVGTFGNFNASDELSQHIVAMIERGHFKDSLPFMARKKFERELLSIAI